jgi:hypothetical protein
MLRLDTAGGALGIFIITIAAIFGGIYVIDCIIEGACK